MLILFLRSWCVGPSPSLPVDAPPGFHKSTHAGPRGGSFFGFKHLSFQRDHPEKMKLIQRRTGEDTFLSEADRIKEENEALKEQLETARRDLAAALAEVELWKQRYEDASRRSVDGGVKPGSGYDAFAFSGSAQPYAMSPAGHSSSSPALSAADGSRSPLAVHQLKQSIGSGSGSAGSAMDAVEGGAGAGGGAGHESKKRRRSGDGGDGSTLPPPPSSTYAQLAYDEPFEFTYDDSDPFASDFLLFEGLPVATAFLNEVPTMSQSPPPVARTIAAEASGGGVGAASSSGAGSQYLQQQQQLQQQQSQGQQQQQQQALLSPGLPTPGASDFDLLLLSSQPSASPVPPALPRLTTPQQPYSPTLRFQSQQPLQGAAAGALTQQQLQQRADVDWTMSLSPMPGSTPSTLPPPPGTTPAVPPPAPSGPCPGGCPGGPLGGIPGCGQMNPTPPDHVEVFGPDVPRSVMSDLVRHVPAECHNRCLDELADKIAAKLQFHRTSSAMDSGAGPAGSCGGGGAGQAAVGGAGGGASGHVVNGSGGAQHATSAHTGVRELLSEVVAGSPLVAVNAAGVTGAAVGCGGSGGGSGGLGEGGHGATGAVGGGMDTAVLSGSSSSCSGSSAAGGEGGGVAVVGGGCGGGGGGGGGGEGGINVQGNSHTVAQAHDRTGVSTYFPPHSHALTKT